jgi:hypothetical protein
MFCEICGTVFDTNGNCINCTKKRDINPSKDCKNPLKVKMGNFD